MQTLEQQIEKIKDGDISALEGVYQKMQKSVYLLSYSILSNSEKAKDILQDIFIKVALNISSYTKNTNPAAWICRIARNLSYTEYSKSKRNTSIEVFEESIPDNKTGEEFWVDNIMLKNAMIKLELQEREIVTLFSQGYKHKEIALIVGKP